MQNNPASHSNDIPTSVDTDEIAKFSAMAEEWWDIKGPFKPLHDITQLRVEYIRNHICNHYSIGNDTYTPLKNLQLVDIGCGGGLASEPMARLGAEVTAIDASEKNIRIAEIHAQQQQLSINYQATTAEQLVSEKQKYDIVMALEIIEHVNDVSLFLEALYALTKPGGIMFITTINRTIKSLLFAKIGAEYILRWLPVGTHDWNKFLQPSEIIAPLEDMGCKQIDLSGLSFKPLSKTWHMNKHDIDVNYLLCLERL